MGLAGTGCGGGVSSDDVARQVKREDSAASVKCQKAGTDANDEDVFRCDVTASGSDLYPELKGQHLTECWSTYTGDAGDVSNVGCGRLKPAAK
jgi:hypothetical protein